MGSKIRLLNLENPIQILFTFCQRHSIEKPMVGRMVISPGTEKVDSSFNFERFDFLQKNKKTFQLCGFFGKKTSTRSQLPIIFFQHTRPKMSENHEFGYFVIRI